MPAIIPLLTTVCLWSAPAPDDNFAGQALDNWHQWRGPLATGMAPHGDPPLQWDQKTNVKWKTPLPGRGSAIFLHVASPDLAP